MTLMELTVGIAIIALVAVTAGSMFVAGMRSFQARHVGNVVMADLRFAMEVVASDLRAATQISPLNSPGVSQIQFIRPSDTVWRGYHISDRTLWLTQTSAAPHSLAANVASLTFAIEPTAISITMTSVTSVDGVTGSGLPLTLTTRVMRRN